MRGQNRFIKVTSLIVIFIGVILLTVNIITGGQFNIALPLVFLVLGTGFFILVLRFNQQWKWALLLYIPGSLLTTFGFVFLLNVLTKDWNSWAYAWLLLIASIGIGLLLANSTHVWPSWLNIVGWGLIAAGLTFFAVFGAIAGGSFIQIAAPVLLVIAGYSFRWLRLETILPDSIYKPPNTLDAEKKVNKISSNNRDVLVENLSLREIEVIRLIDSGLSNQEIAEKLSVAPSTIKTHINNIYSKLGVQTRVQAINRARELGILDI